MNAVTALFTVTLLGTTPIYYLHAQPAASAGTGTITGRVLNEATGQYLRNAVVKVAGTDITVLTGNGGNYAVVGAPAGQVKLQVSYADLDAQEVTVNVSAGQTVSQDFNLNNQAYSNVVKMGEFVVASEREGNAKALQEQREALEIKTVLASDALGNVSEGNVGEFLKLMPGVQMDYVEADVRTMSIGGMDPKYSTILMDGAPIASAGSSSIDTGRAFEFEQLSIASIETIELSKTPTPDVSGSALAGVVNLRTKGAFDRKGRQVKVRSSLAFNSLDLDLKETPGPRDKKSWKIQPNISVDYSDVFAGKLGVLAGFNYSYTFGEQKANTNTYAFDADPTNNATEIPRLQTLNLQDSPKPTVRKNYNLRLDYRFSDQLSIWGRVDYNTYDAQFFARDVNFDFRNTLATNANTTVNAPGSTAPANAATPYTLLDQTSTTGSVTIDGNHGAQKKYGWTQTFSGGGSYRAGAFTADLIGSFSRATNWYKDVPQGWFNSISTPRLQLNGVRWTRSSADNPDWQITSLGGVNFTNAATYPGAITGVGSNDRSGEDQKYTLKLDMRYPLEVFGHSIVLKGGGDINESVKNVERRSYSYTYLGPDLVAASGDESAANFSEKVYRINLPFNTNVQNIIGPDRFALAREFGAHPERFTQPSAGTLLTQKLRNHWDTKEQIDSLFLQPIVKVTPKFDVAPGVRWERTRGISRGPNDIGDAAARRILTGSTTGTVVTDSVDYVQTRYGSQASAGTNYDTWLKYLHLNYRFNDRLTFRMSYNDSITRPDPNRLAGGITVTNELADPPTASVPNPDLKPEHGVNKFVSAEYYFPKGGGFVTVSFARRDIDQLIRTTPEDIPIGGSYAGDPFFGGYRINTADNVAKAHTSSLEFNYRQNLGFLGDRAWLPSTFWRRVQVFGNFTRLWFDNYENFRRPQLLANGGVTVGLGDVSVSWRVNWTPMFRRGAAQANGWTNFDDERILNDVELGWKISRRYDFFITARNVFNEPTRTVWGNPNVNILNRYFESGSIFTMGLNATF